MRTHICTGSIRIWRSDGFHSDNTNITVYLITMIAMRYITAVCNIMVKGVYRATRPDENDL